MPTLQRGEAERACRSHGPFSASCRWSGGACVPTLEHRDEDCLLLALDVHVVHADGLLLEAWVALKKKPVGVHYVDVKRQE